MESGKKSFDSFRNLVIILVVLCYTVIHSMSLRWYVVSEQFNYTKTRVFHAILMPVIIEFSRCIGTYSSAKFELINLIVEEELYKNADGLQFDLEKLCSDYAKTERKEMRTAQEVCLILENLINKNISEHEKCIL